MEKIEARNFQSGTEAGQSQFHAKSSRRRFGGAPATPCRLAGKTRACPCGPEGFRGVNYVAKKSVVFVFVFTFILASLTLLIASAQPAGLPGPTERPPFLSAILKANQLEISGQFVEASNTPEPGGCAGPRPTLNANKSNSNSTVCIVSALIILLRRTPSSPLSKNPSVA